MVDRCVFVYNLVILRFQFMLTKKKETGSQNLKIFSVVLFVQEFTEKQITLLSKLLLKHADIYSPYKFIEFNSTTLVCLIAIVS